MISYTMKQKRTIRTLRGGGRILPAAIGLILGLLVSCTQEEVPGSTREALLTVSRVTIAGEATPTRAGAQPEPIFGKLGVGVRAQNGYTARELVYAYAEDGWITSVKVGLTDNAISLYAWHPQDGTAVTSGKIALATQTYAAGKDLTYAATGGYNVCAAHPYAGFVLQHVYARVLLDVRIAPSVVGGSSKIESVFLSAPSDVFPQNGTLTIGTGAFAAGTTLADRLDWPAGFTVASISYTYQGDLLVIPVAALSNISFNMMIDGRAWSVKLGSALTAFESGKSYRIRASLGTDLTVNAVQVESWNDTSLGSQEMQFE